MRGESGTYDIDEASFADTRGLVIKSSSISEDKLLMRTLDLRTHSAVLGAVEDLLSDAEARVSDVTGGWETGPPLAMSLISKTKTRKFPSVTT